MANSQRTPLPAKQLFILCTIVFSEPVSLTILFPFIYFMVRDFHVTENHNEIGFYVGYISAAFSLAQMFSGLFWGWLSDRWGRRPVLLIGLLGNTVTSIAFGLSQSLTWCILSRFSCGLLNGNIGVAKSALGEITDASNQGKGFSIFGLVFGLGCIVAPVLGGVFSNPAKVFPDLFGNIPFLISYPYFLPCFLSSIVSFVGFIVGYQHLEETKGRASTPNHTEQGGHSETEALISSPCTRFLATGQYCSLHSVSGRVQKNNIFNSAVLSGVSAYALVSLVQITLDETYPLWAVASPSVGGLGFTPSEVGTSLSFVGVMILFVQLILFPFCQQRWGIENCYTFGFLMYGIVLAILPQVNSALLLVEKGVLSSSWVWVELLSLLTMRVIASSFVFTCCMIFVNIAGKKSNDLGIVNGMAQCTVSFMRTVGPVLGGSLWSWSLLSNLPYPLDFHTVFYFLTLLCILGGIHGYVIYMKRNVASTLNY